MENSLIFLVFHHTECYVKQSTYRLIKSTVEEENEDTKKTIENGKTILEEGAVLIDS